MPDYEAVIDAALISTVTFREVKKGTSAQTGRGVVPSLLVFFLFICGCHSTGSSTAGSPVNSVPPSGSIEVLTYHNDTARTGLNAAESVLTTLNVNSSSFGKLGFLAVDGLVDAEPLYVSSLSIAGTAHNVVFVATENDSAYAFDADTFVQLWKVSVLGAGETTSEPVHGCGQVAPQIGITATPVIDLQAGAHGTLFVVAMTKDSAGNYHQRLHALDLSNGAEQAGSPREIQAAYPGSGDNSQNGQVLFDPMQYEERAGLLLLNGIVYTGWTSHCDIGPYTGWIMGYSESTLQQASVLDVTPNGSEGSIWMSGAGLAADSANNIYFLDANGTFDSTLNANGQPVNGDYGNAFLKLSTAGNRLAVVDYFTMFDTSTESSGDEDLGSGGALLLPDLKDNSGNTWQLAVGSGKDGNIYVVNRNQMGGLQTKQDMQIYQESTASSRNFRTVSIPHPAISTTRCIMAPCKIPSELSRSLTLSFRSTPLLSPGTHSDILEQRLAFLPMGLRMESCGRLKMALRACCMPMTQRTWRRSSTTATWRERAISLSQPQIASS